MSEKRYYIETYGCQMNLADSEIITRILQDAGWQRVDEVEQAEVVLLNTCAIREKAEERIVGRLGNLLPEKQRRPHLKIGVVGCMAQHSGELLSASRSFVSFWVGPDNYRKLPELLREEQATRLELGFDTEENYLGLEGVREGGPNAWVPIQRGCNNYCSYCIVPYVRGRSRCVPKEEVLRQVRAYVSNGAVQVTLLGQTVNSYRSDGEDFPSLLRKVASVEGVQRIRFMSPHPRWFTPELVRAFAEIEELCPHVHLPLQSGSDEVLKRMGRSYSASDYRRIVESLKATVPGVSITTDVIVGFCGESENDFDLTMGLIEKEYFDAAFMFAYSERDGTRAAREFEDDVPWVEKVARLKRLIATQEAISKKCYQAKVGKVVEVLIEGRARRTGSMHAIGKSEDFKSTLVRVSDVAVGESLKVLVKEASSHTLKGVPLRQG